MAKLLDNNKMNVSPIAIVCKGFNQHGHASRPVPLVTDIFELRSLTTLSGSLGNRPVNIRGRYSSGSGFADRRTQLEVSFWIAPVSCCDHDFPPQPSENGSALGIHYSFCALDL